MQPEPVAFDPKTIPAQTTINYPEQFASVCKGREKRPVGDACGLTNFGVNLTTLQPNAASALRHWHSAQDEFIYVLEGEPTLVTDEGEQLLKPGMAAGFPKGKPNGHQLINRGSAPVVYLEIGDRTFADEVEYPGIDLAVRIVEGRRRYTHNDGRLYRGEGQKG